MHIDRTDPPWDIVEVHIDGLIANGSKVAEQVIHPIIFDADAEPTRVSAAALALIPRFATFESHRSNSQASYLPFAEHPYGDATHWLCI
ncbi:hypothetical protein [Archangium sp.]|uniref:hypothetical protein n=1 Tax=Archangium sp. TaxID=1872627 RepID=UPI002D48745F|nr:hypothetical protein [Archangium sp.]HYO52226.1 hypothetical protein [Archangium sp.]